MPRLSSRKLRPDEDGSNIGLRDDLIPRVVGRLLVPFILLFGLYVQFHGDYGPGGGFQAGALVAAGTWVLPPPYETTGGIYEGLVSRPSCYDGLQNGDETDVDCGLDCGKCSVGQGCTSPSAPRRRASTSARTSC